MAEPNRKCRRRKFIDLTGERFGKLIALNLIDPTPGVRRWLCKCDCGNMKEVRSTSLVCGKTKSCGCFISESITARNLKHGLSRTAEYGIWNKMIGRCHDIDNPAYSNYGGRGIFVCDRWKHSPENFIADMGPRPPRHTIERVNNDGPYSPDNCTWATRTRQANNRRSNRLVEFNGVTMSVADWSRKFNIRCQNLLCRLNLGWSVEDALTKPNQHNNYKQRSAS